MTKRLISIIGIFFLILPLQAQDYFNKKENQHSNHLILVHPTRANLERYTYLINNKIINTGKLKLVGVYFENENYDYSLLPSDYPQIGFHKVAGDITLKDLYGKNDLSDEYSKIFRYSKGIIFNGGPDLPPATYKEKMALLTSVSDPYRHYFELSFLFHLIGGSQDEEFVPLMKKRPRYSIVAICLGLQTLNVAAGGNLIQDIPSEVYNKTTVEDILQQPEDQHHRNYYSQYRLYPEIPSYFLHPVQLTEGRWLGKVNPSEKTKTPYVFSSHHQAIDKLGKNLRIAATSMDGKIIEAIEHNRFPNIIGVQFHPEVDYLYKPEKNHKFSPEEELFSLKEELIRRHSYDFHTEFWKKVSKAYK